MRRYTRPTGAVRIRQGIQDLNILTCVRKLAPIASQARHFPPHSGEATAKEKRIHIFYMNKNKNMGMNHTKKPSPLVGEGGNRQVDGRGKLEQKRKNENSMSKIKY